MSRLGRIGTGLAVAVAATALATASVAQEPGRGEGEGRPGRPGAPGQGRGDFGGRGPGGFGRMPFVTGRVTGGDRNTGLIEVTMQVGAGIHNTVRVGQATKFVSQSQVTVGDLKVGDVVQVQGVPTGITASSISAGEMPDFLRPGGPQGGGNPPQGRTLDAPRGRDGGPAAQAFANANGKVTSTSPLTIQVGDGVSIVLKLAANAKITKLSPATFASLKVGDEIMAAGQMGEDGIFNATGIGINLGFGGGFGFGGPGFRGPGGPGGFGRGGFPGGPPMP